MSETVSSSDRFELARNLHERGKVSHAVMLTDHEHMSFAEKKASLEVLIQLMATEYGLTELFKTGDESGIYPAARKEIQKYRAVNQALHDEVSTPDAEQTLREIAVRYQNTAEIPYGEFLEDVREGNPRVIVFDFDNTVTDFEKYRPDVIDPLLVGSESLDPLIGTDREYQVPIIASVWQPIAKTSSDIFAEGGAQVPFREGMKELLEFLVKQKGVAVKIISTNFAPFVESALRGIEGAEKIETFCIRDQDARSTEKGDLLRKIQLRNRKSVLEFVGDGSSDLTALKAASIVPGFHAVQGQSFDREMNNRQIAHTTFTNGWQLAENLGYKMPQAA